MYDQFAWQRCTVVKNEFAGAASCLSVGYSRDAVAGAAMRFRGITSLAHALFIEDTRPARHGKKNPDRNDTLTNGDANRGREAWRWLARLLVHESPRHVAWIERTNARAQGPHAAVKTTDSHGFERAAAAAAAAAAVSTVVDAACRYVRSIGSARHSTNDCIGGRPGHMRPARNYR